MLNHQMINPVLQATGSLAAIGMALTYLTMFVVFGAILAFPENASISQKISYMQQNYLLLSFTWGIGYLLFGILLAVLVQAIHNRLQQPQSASALLNTASLFGVIWVVLMMATGMIMLTSLNLLFKLQDSSPADVSAVYYALSMIENGLGGGIELVGGIWVLLLSIVALKQQQLTKNLNLLGLLVGSTGILTVLHTLPYLKDIFGISQLLWFIWLGIIIWRQRNNTAR